MLGNMLKLGTFLALFSVAPAAATQRATLHRSACPMERARAAAAALRTAPAARPATTVAATDRLFGADGWVFGPMRRSGVLNP
jgi:hypothetical protein